MREKCNSARRRTNVCIFFHFLAISSVAMRLLVHFPCGVDECASCFVGSLVNYCRERSRLLIHQDGSSSSKMVSIQKCLNSFQVFPPQSLQPAISRVSNYNFNHFGCPAIATARTNHTPSRASVAVCPIPRSASSIWVVRRPPSRIFRCACIWSPMSTSS